MIRRPCAARAPMHNARRRNGSKEWLTRGASCQVWLALACLFIGLSAGSACAQTGTGNRTSDALATQQYHGVGAIPERVRQAVASDEQVITRYAAWLEGRRPAPLKWDTATVLWWLAESDNPAYVPLFARFSADSDEQVQMMAVYGLVRHAEVAAARERLLDIVARPSSRGQRTSLAVALLHVGGPAARGIMARISASDLPRNVAVEVEWLRLQSTPARHKGNWPCSGATLLRRATSGVHTCQQP